MPEHEILSLADDAEWKSFRRTHIGASEAASILWEPGSAWKRPFGSPWSVWAEKKGRVSSQREESPMMEWGKRHEDSIAEKYCEATGRRVEDPGEFYVESRGILSATPDRWQWAEGRPDYASRGILEIKCAWFDAFDQWGTTRDRGVPVAYQIQMQQQLYVCGLDFANIAVLGNGYQYREYEVERNDKFIERLVSRLSEWWEEYILGDVPPPTDGHPATSDAIKGAYREYREKDYITLDDDLAAVHERRKDLGDRITELETQREAESNRIKAEIGESEGGILPDGSTYSYKANSRGTRTLRFSEKKG
jgi:putative phage-type endonuclease